MLQMVEVHSRRFFLVRSTGVFSRGRTVSVLLKKEEDGG
jgi:hypothetical protein